MANDINKGAGKKLFEYARENRKQPTGPEELLWKNLKSRKLLNKKIQETTSFEKFHS